MNGTTITSRDFVYADALSSAYANPTPKRIDSVAATYTASLGLPEFSGVSTVRSVYLLLSSNKLAAPVPAGSMPAFAYTLNLSRESEISRFRMCN